MTVSTAMDFRLHTPSKYLDYYETSNLGSTWNRIWAAWAIAIFAAQVRFPVEAENMPNFTNCNFEAPCCAIDWTM